jgi:hypothetical protein
VGAAKVWNACTGGYSSSSQHDSVIGFLNEFRQAFEFDCQSSFRVFVFRQATDALYENECETQDFSVEKIDSKNEITKGWNCILVTTKATHDTRKRTDLVLVF